MNSCPEHGTTFIGAYCPACPVVVWLVCEACGYEVGPESRVDDGNRECPCCDAVAMMPR